MLAQTQTFRLQGLSAQLINIEADVRRGLPSFTIVGLPDVAVRETRERVRAAILNEGFEFPQLRITLNAAPEAEGAQRVVPSMDLAIAAAILAASGQLDPEQLEDIALVGELSLDGTVRLIRGAIVFAEASAHEGLRLIVPSGNTGEAQLAPSATTAAISRLSQLQTLAAADFVTNEESGESATLIEPDTSGNSIIDGPDIRDLRGHANAIRALTIAAAGGHNIFLSGSPGCGKTMLARRLPSILPAMTRAEAIDVTKMQSIAGYLRVDSLVTRRPFRAPHQTISSAGLLGGGTVATPGEVTLAHNGVLFLDETPEFSSRTLQALRQPIETGTITITRDHATRTYPARFQLVAAGNPCPCGAGDARCRCTAEEIARYKRRLSQPFIDHVDLFVNIKRPTPAEVEAGPVASSTNLREQVASARAIQRERYKTENISCNAELDGAQTRRWLTPPDEIRGYMNELYRRGSLSLRGFDRCLRVARTIADLSGDAEISNDAIEEALALVSRDQAAAVTSLSPHELDEHTPRRFTLTETNEFEIVLHDHAGRSVEELTALYGAGEIEPARKEPTHCDVVLRENHPQST